MAQFGLRLLSVVAAVTLRACIPAAATSTLITNPVTLPPVYLGAWKLDVWATGETVAADHRNRPSALGRTGDHRHPRRTGKLCDDQARLLRLAGHAPEAAQSSTPRVERSLMC